MREATIKITCSNQDLLTIRLESFEKVNEEYWNKKVSKLKELLDECPTISLEEIIISIKTLFQDFEAFVFSLFLKNPLEKKEINYTNGQLTEYNYHTFALEVYYYKNGELNIQTRKNDIYNIMVEKINKCLAEIKQLANTQELNISYKDNIILETFKDFYGRNINFKNPNDVLLLQNMIYILKEYNALDEYISDYEFNYIKENKQQISSRQLEEWFNKQSYLVSLLYDATNYVGIDEIKKDLTSKIRSIISKEIATLSEEEQINFLNNIVNLLYMKKNDGNEMYQFVLDNSPKAYTRVLQNMEN